ncbi:MAG: hypothetical protein JNJ50_26430 [Acidobacteria bacterium]|nr:hypothetical protein [Acidobacteriota bacterium]
MARILKVQCNGAGQHVNDVDLDRALEESVVYRGAESRLHNLPERGVTLKCQMSGCTGRIVITRLMLEEMLGADHV